jgi:VIT1/CCC1 family predicted Fe2+/Mn2+ transporter
MGDFLSSKAQMEYHVAERRREAWECDNWIEGEKEEMIQVYQKKGMSREHARAVVEIMSLYRDSFIDTMMVEELGLMPPDPGESPAKEGGVTFISFLLFGCVPILAYVATSIIYGKVRNI